VFKPEELGIGNYAKVGSEAKTGATIGNWELSAKRIKTGPSLTWF
jgi:hypothetical protein